MNGVYSMKNLDSLRLPTIGEALAAFVAGVLVAASLGSLEPGYADLVRHTPTPALSDIDRAELNSLLEVVVRDASSEGQIRTWRK